MSNNTRVDLDGLEGIRSYDVDPVILRAVLEPSDEKVEKPALEDHIPKGSITFPPEESEPLNRPYQV